jgi:hypothetical protein
LDGDLREANAEIQSGSYYGRFKRHNDFDRVVSHDRVGFFKIACKWLKRKFQQRKRLRFEKSFRSLPWSTQIAIGRLSPYAMMGHCGFIMAHGHELRMYRRLLNCGVVQANTWASFLFHLCLTPSPERSGNCSKEWTPSALSRCLREKGLNLLLYFSAVAAWALNPFFVVLADCHCEGETLATLFAMIFVMRHRNPPLELLWRRN